MGVYKHAQPDQALSFSGNQGSVVFLSAGGNPSEDNANLFWDDVNNRLGVGLNTPAYTFHTVGDSMQQTAASSPYYSLMNSTNNPTSQQYTGGLYVGAGPFDITALGMGNFGGLFPSLFPSSVVPLAFDTDGTNLASAKWCKTDGVAFNHSHSGNAGVVTINANTNNLIASMTASGTGGQLSIDTSGSIFKYATAGGDVSDVRLGSADAALRFYGSTYNSVVNLSDGSAVIALSPPVAGNDPATISLAPTGITFSLDVNTVMTLFNNSGTMEWGVFGSKSAQAAALSSIDAGAINTGDATTDTIIGDLRTVVNELKTGLTAYGQFA